MSKRLPGRNMRELDKRAQAIEMEMQRDNQKGDSGKGRHYNIDQ